MNTEPIQLMEPITAQAKRILHEMAKTRDLNDRKLQSDILLNLCKSMGVCCDLISEEMNMSDIPDLLEDFEDEHDDDGGPHKTIRPPF